MRTIVSLTDLAPWFSTLSLALTRQQARSMPSVGGGSIRYTLYICSSYLYSLSPFRSPTAIIERIIELDFLEEII